MADFSLHRENIKTNVSVTYLNQVITSFKLETLLCHVNQCRYD